MTVHISVPVEDAGQHEILAALAEARGDIAGGWVSSHEDVVAEFEARRPLANGL